MKKMLLLFSLVTILSSCSFTHELEVEIENFSENEIRDIRFYTSDEKEIFTADVLSPGEDISHTLAINNYDADGTYTFEFVQPNGEKITKTGSYMEEEEYLKNVLTFRVVNGGVEVETRVIEREDLQ